MVNAYIEINNLAISAQQALKTGSDMQFNQLLTALNTHKNTATKFFTQRIPSLDAADVQSLYNEVLWMTCMKYDASTGDFMSLFYTVLKRRVYSLARKSVPYSQRNTSLEKITEDDCNMAIIPRVPSAEDVFMEREVIDSYIADIAKDPEIGPYERAVIQTRIEDGLSVNQAVNIAGGIFRNKQQLWRTERRAARKGRF